MKIGDTIKISKKLFDESESQFLEANDVFNASVKFASRSATIERAAWGMIEKEVPEFDSSKMGAVFDREKKCLRIIKMVGEPVD